MPMSLSDLSSKVGDILLSGQEASVPAESAGAEGADKSGAGAGTGVGAHQHVTFPEVVAEAHLESVVAVVARIFEHEVAAGAAGRVVDKTARSAFFEEFRF